MGTPTANGFSSSRKLKQDIRIQELEQEREVDCMHPYVRTCVCVYVRSYVYSFGHHSSLKDDVQGLIVTIVTLLSSPLAGGWLAI